MTVDLSPITKYLLLILFFPTLFQSHILAFAWGADDSFLIMVLKRTFILLPIAAFLVGVWASVISVLTVIFRSKRQEFLTSLLATWWDYFKSVFAFWGGFLRFLLVLGVALIEFSKIFFISVWTIIQDLFLIPFRILRSAAENVLTPGIPWIAVTLTVLWCLVEAIIFTYVMTPVVLDTLSNLTGDSLSPFLLRIPLFFFLLLLVLGSYSVLSTWADAIASRKIPTIIKITIVEFVALLVEILFLYREFVDSLVPWFAQHSGGNFDLGIFGTLFISGIAWFGVRSMSWFLFASHGTPTLMAIIQGSGVKPRELPEQLKGHDAFEFTGKMFNKMKQETDWIKTKAEEVLGAFVLPGLQVVASALNFATLLITSRHMFTLPFKNLKDVMTAEGLVQRQKRRSSNED
ncbi:MAG: hypothetical protein AB7F43_00110 [Bacteriovoracia bacterium]